MTGFQKLYFQMLRIRRVEQEIARRYSEQQMRCPIHLSIGQEAAAVGVMSNLLPHDQVVSTHRGHAHYLAKGGSLRGLLCELYGKADGCSRGQGGSMHLVDRSVGFAGSTSIVAGTVPVGVGLAFAKKQKQEPGTVVICIGDAVVEEGVFHEAANFASLHDLNVIFVLENNLYSCYTHLRERQPAESFRRFADAHMLDYLVCDGNDITQVQRCMSAHLGGPTLLTLHTYRHLEHCGPNNDDHLGYRDQRVTADWLERDPLRITEQCLYSIGEWTPEFVESFALIEEEIRAEFEYAIKAPFPDQSELGKFEYASN